MRFLALATDYDGTLAHDGRVSGETLEALRRLKESGRKVILVSGRQLPELQEAFPESDLCDLIVAENGALLWNPQTRTETPLAKPPPPRFAEELRRRGALPLAEGRVIVATWEPHETTVFETIRDLGLEMQVIFNKGAVMILPSGVNKASGLQAALSLLGLSPHNVVAVGDAENDHAMLELCEAGVATSNALPSLKEGADLVTEGDHGRGVTELIDRLLRDDLADLKEKLLRHDFAIGERGDKAAVTVPAYGTGILIAGTSGGGKSTLAASFLELESALVLGNAKHAPELSEVTNALRQPEQNCVVSLLGIEVAERPAYFEKLFAELMQLRAWGGRTG
jgi:hydroxymethylpyrimidine pyrophosphatase-like HAD family hydrolase